MPATTASPAYVSLLADEAGQLQRSTRSRSNSGLNSLKESAPGPPRADQEQVALGEARLDRRDVDRLQQLRLEQLADAGDLVPRQDGVGVGEEAVGRVVRRIGVDRLPALDQRELLEAEVACRSGPGSRCGPPGRSRAAGASGTPRGCRSARSPSAGRAAPRPAGSSSAWRSRRRTTASDRSDRAAWRRRTRARRAAPASPRSRPCRGSCGRARCWGRGSRPPRCSRPPSCELAVADLGQTRARAAAADRPDPSAIAFSKASRASVVLTRIR